VAVLPVEIKNKTNYSLESEFLRNN